MIQHTAPAITVTGTDRPLHHADFRPILVDDIGSAVRGCELRHAPYNLLVESIQRHAAVDMFASAVIVCAAARMLHRQGAFDWDDFTVSEICAIARDPDPQVGIAARIALGLRD